jgi:tetratricopeptide (TPR) repeat protein
LRELMGKRPDRSSGDDLLHCWDNALAKWASTAAWYGLHGFCLMGCLGAISSRSRIIQNYRTPPPPPHGAFASEYYSIAKKVGDPRLRAAFFELALNHLDVTLRAQPDSQALAIRGSVYWQLGRRANAIEDYERVVEICEQSGVPPAALGSAKAELGFALVQSRRGRRRGLSLLEEGVVLGSSGRPDGFLVRAKRKLGYGYFLAGSPRRAMAELVDAYDIAADHSLFDQISKIERAAKRVDRLVPFLKHR